MVPKTSSGKEANVFSRKLLFVKGIGYGIKDMVCDCKEKRYRTKLLAEKTNIVLVQKISCKNRGSYYTYGLNLYVVID